MDSGLSSMNVFVLVAYAFAMAGGQILFKFAALRVADESIGERLLGLAQSTFFLFAVALYVALTVVWVWILTFTPLSRAYAFVALAFVLTPVAGAMIFSEPISVRFVVGTAFVVMGLFCIAG